MMTKEEYQKELVRMWDSIRSRSDCKGTSGCSSVDCNFCPFNRKVCNLATNTIFNAYKSIEIVEQWAEQHPIVTNSDKFKEVFGLDMAPIHSCVSSKSCEDCEYTYDGKCAVSKLFWDAEYKEPAESEVEG